MGSNIRILILEDVPLDLELMEAELKRDNIDFISRCVEEEVEYRKEIEEFKPDIILADHSLPHFDGISAMYIARELVPEISLEIPKTAYISPFLFFKGIRIRTGPYFNGYITQRLYEWGGGSQDHQKEPGNSYYLSDGLFQHGNFSGCQDHSTAGLSHQTL